MKDQEEGEDKMAYKIRKPRAVKQVVKGKEYWRVPLRPAIRRARAGYLPERKGIRFLVQRVDSVSRLKSALFRTDRYSKEEALKKGRKYRQKIAKYEPRLVKGLPPKRA